METCVISAETLKPMRGMLLVQPEMTSNVSAGGIIKVESKARPELEYGTVLKIGLPKRDKTGAVHRAQIMPGHRICFLNRAGTAIKAASGEPFLLMDEKEVVGVITE